MHLVHRPGNEHRIISVLTVPEDCLDNIGTFLFAIQFYTSVAIFGIRPSHNIQVLCYVSATHRSKKRQTLYDFMTFLSGPV